MRWVSVETEWVRWVQMLSHGNAGISGSAHQFVKIHPAIFKNDKKRLDFYGDRGRFDNVDQANNVGMV